MRMITKLLTVATAVLLIAQTTTKLAAGQNLDDAQLTKLSTYTDAIQAYIYGYPLIMFGITERIAITVPDATTKLGGAPLNQFGKEEKLPDASFTAVVLPSTSTLYASSFLNLQAEPVILHIPNMNGRFFVLQMLDAWTDVSAQSPGSRLGSMEGDYALVGPDFKDQLPSTISPQNIINIPTNSMWIIGRIYTNGSQSDIDDVKANIYPGLTLTPLSFYGKNYKAPTQIPLDPSLELETAPVRQANGMDACSFFGTLAALMKSNRPVLPQDEKILATLNNIGITPGNAFDCTTLRDRDPGDREKLAALQLGVTTARRLVDTDIPVSETPTRWSLPLNVGTYGDQYYLRAEVAHSALGANNPKDAVYGYTRKDNRNAMLDGSSRYTIHFNAKTNLGRPREIPSVQGFWSVTIYDADGKLVPNDVVKYNAIGDPYVNDHQACFNSDKSLDLYLQPDPPSDQNSFCNWLPTPPNSNYIVFLRMYWPGDAILSGRWFPPGIRRAN